MNIPSGELSDILTDIDNILSVCGTETADPETSSTDMTTLAQALEQLADVMSRVESDIQAGGNTEASDVTEIGAYALQLQEALSAAAAKQALVEQQQTLAMVAINMALWVARHGGQIESLETVADALAQFANKCREPAKLGELNTIISDIIPAVSASIRQDLGKMNPGRPWRVLLLNHSIVATRSHDPERMEAAFTLLGDQLPEDACQFFSEGMQQMEALDYPAHVREVMEKYHRQWPVNHALH